MKNYTITVNGNVYDVTVEEKGAGAAPAAPVKEGGSEGSAGTQGGSGKCGGSHRGESRRSRKGI